VSKKNLKELEKGIERIKNELMSLGRMRPGRLTCQYKDPKNKTGPFWQLSYTYKMKSRTEYVRPQFLKSMEQQTATFRRFKELVDDWIDLSVECSKLEIEMIKRNEL
jgi:hypothetical protein